MVAARSCERLKKRDALVLKLIAFADGLVMGMVTNAKSARLSFLYSNDWLASPSAYPLSVRAPKTSLDVLADSLASRHAPGGCGEVKAIEVHHFGPGSNKVLDELHVRVRASVHF